MGLIFSIQPMKKHILALYILLSVLLTSCIPGKDLIYLQEKDKGSAEKTVDFSNRTPYKLQVNDILSITIRAIDPKMVEIFNVNTGQSATTISEQSNYINGYSIDSHGNIRMPILGEFGVLGYTLDEVRNKVEQLLHEKYFKNEAGIFVTVKLSGFRYTINGEVGSTGTKVIYQDRVTIMEAIANAGDINVTGQRKDVKVMRLSPKGIQTYSIDLTDSNAVNSPCFYLQPNDYIYVKPLKQKTWGTGKTGIESLSTLITLLSLATTTFLLLKK